jgi:hypothetical protein
MEKRPQDSLGQEIEAEIKIATMISLTFLSEAFNGHGVDVQKAKM